MSDFWFTPFKPGKGLARDYPVCMGICKKVGDEFVPMEFPHECDDEQMFLVHKKKDVKDKPRNIKGYEKVEEVDGGMEA